MSIVFESDYDSYTCKLHLESFFKLTPGSHLKSNMFFIQEHTVGCKHVLLVTGKNVALHNLSLINFEKTCHCIISYQANLATGRECQLVTGKRTERTKHDFWCSICCSAVGQASCLIYVCRHQLTFPFCC